MPGTLSALYRYPVKGLTAHLLPEVPLSAGRGLPLDRAYSIENGFGRFDERNPQIIAKINFLTLMRDERLAAIDARFDEKTQILTLSRSGKQVARGDLSTTAGRAILEQFFAGYMGRELRGPPKIRHAYGHSFADTGPTYVHLILKETVEDLGRALGRPVSPLRFRPNFIVDGFQAWEDLSWPGRWLAIGNARLKVVERTERCAATNVDPSTGARDLDIPAALRRHWGHSDVGIYAEVIDGGLVRQGDDVRIAD
jgi:uncharacterized protein